jgi:hypothetical protein
MSDFIISPFCERLSSGYADPSWIIRNSTVINSLRGSPSLALAGSVLHGVRGNNLPDPGDIDIVAKDLDAARSLIILLENKLMEMEYAHWRVFTNFKTKYVPSNCIAHYRIQSAVWLPICIFVLKPSRFRSWFTPEAIPMQNYRDVHDAAEELQEKDGKTRNILSLDLSDPLDLEYSSSIEPNNGSIGRDK